MSQGMAHARRLCADGVRAAWPPARPQAPVQQKWQPPQLEDVAGFRQPCSARRIAHSCWTPSSLAAPGGCRSWMAGSRSSHLNGLKKFEANLLCTSWAPSTATFAAGMSLPQQQASSVANARREGIYADTVWQRHEISSMSKVPRQCQVCFLFGGVAIAVSEYHRHFPRLRYTWRVESTER